MAKYIHIPRFHPAVKFPPDWIRAGIGCEQFGFTLTLTEDCRYEPISPHLDGYNKAGGVAFGIYAQNQSVMLGWQPAPPYLNFCFYWHDGVKPGSFDFYREPGMAAMPGEKVAWWCLVDYELEQSACFFQRQGGARFAKLVKLPGMGRFHRDIHPWFGDTGTPPHRMSFEKERIWRWENHVPYDVAGWKQPNASKIFRP